MASHSITGTGHSQNFVSHRVPLNQFIQFRVLREKGTERPGTGKYDKYSEDGVYSCAGCGTPLYKSTTKFNVRSSSLLQLWYESLTRSLRVDAVGPHSLTVCNAHCLLSTGPIRWTALPGAVSRHEDETLGMTRIEITCTACGGHLGHVFKGEGFNTPSVYIFVALLLLYVHQSILADERHCVNSVSLKFKEESQVQ
jgi:peptide-methionine (R)-S-oxide reductase